jgi:hypothetical protein
MISLSTFSHSLTGGLSMNGGNVMREETSSIHQE